MSTDGELELRRDDAVDVQPQATQTADMLALIFRAASDPACNTANMKDLLAMAERMEDRQREKEFNNDLATVQALMPQLDQRGAIEYGKGKPINYALLEDIDLQIRPIYSEHGFAVAWDTEYLDGRIRVIGDFKHRCGRSERRSVTLPSDTSGGKNNVQASGSTVTYGRRMLLKMFFNLIEKGQDTDGANLDKITQKQADEIRDKLTELGANITAFCDKVMGVEKIEDILATRIDEAWNQINMKARKVQR